MKGLTAAFLLLLATIAFPAEPIRIIAILENERMLEAEPDLKLIDYFLSSSEAVRARAVLAAARIGNPVLLPALEPLTADPSVAVRKYLAFAAGQIRSKKGLSLATRLLKDPDMEVRRLAVEAIGRIGGIEATTFLVPFLDDAVTVLREQAALALALIKDKGTVDLLMKKAAAADSAQWSYVYALYRLADDRSVPILHQVLLNPVSSPSTGDPSSILFALKALWSMKKSLTTAEAERLLQQEDQRVVQNTLDVLGAGGDNNVCGVIHKVYDAMDALTKVKALEAMSALGCVPEARPSSANLFGPWLIAQAKTQKEKALPLLQEAMKNENWTVRWRTAQALAELPAATAIPLLKTLTGDADSIVRLTALDSLAKYFPETVEVFVPLLQDKDFAIRATAVDAVGKTKDKKYLPVLIKTYDASQDPAEIEGRVALLDVLQEFNTSEILPLYERALLDPEYTIRRHALDGMKKLVGNMYYKEGKVRDLEESLYLQGKVTQKKIDEYPESFGKSPGPVTVTMKLEKGDVVIRLLGADAPLHSENFARLAVQKFYDGLRIHRVVPNFVIQGGDPRGDGWGGAGEIVHDQFNLFVYRRGMVGMPSAGKDTGGAQFFITHSRQPHLDGNYTIFGEVISGMDVVDRTEVGDKIISVVYRRDR